MKTTIKWCPDTFDRSLHILFDRNQIVGRVAPETKGDERGWGWMMYGPPRRFGWQLELDNAKAAAEAAWK
jgi:hypothetical protein